MRRQRGPVGGRRRRSAGAGHRRWLDQCGGPNLALMVCLRDAGEGARRGGGGRGTGTAVTGGGGTGAADVEAMATLVQRRDVGQDREWRKEKWSQDI
jgi:hypothetical protein